MASSTSNTILISANGGERPVFELLANGVVKPGELLAIASGKFDQHAAANGAAAPWFALENPYGDDPTAAAISNNYADGESVRAIHAQPGDIVYAYIKASESLVFGVTRLVSDGAGALQAETVDADTPDTAVVAIAWETVSVGGAAARYKVKVV